MTPKQEPEQHMKYLGYTISKRKDGRYYTRFKYNGRTIHIYGKTQQECKNKLKNALNNPANYNNYETLHEWLDKWLEIEKKPRLKESSFSTLKIIINKHIKKIIDNLKLNEIKPIDIDTALQKIESSRIKKYAYQIFGGAMLYAYKNGFTDKNLKDLITPVQHIKNKGKGLTKEQQKIFLHSTKKLQRPWIWQFYLFSGVRRSEALTLTWEDIKEDYILIRGTKTINAERKLPLFEKLKQILAEVPKTSDNIFNISLTTLKRDALKLSKLCGFDFAIKDLRHTFASNCYEIGIKDKVLQSWMGHSTINTTKDYYIHPTQELEKVQIDLYNKQSKD